MAGIGVMIPELVFTISGIPISSSVADRTEFWWNPKRPDQPSLWESKIYLGEEFFNEIIRHPVPLDMNILTALKRCSLGLDLYLWLNYRTFALTSPLQITWRNLVAWIIPKDALSSCFSTPGIT